MDDIAFEIKCRQYLVKRLGILKRDLEKTVAKEQEVRKARIKELCEYEDAEQAQEAYGNADITLEEYNAVRDVLEKGAKFAESKTPKFAALEILVDFMVRQNREIRDFEWELKTPEERERIEKFNAEFRASHGSNWNWESYKTEIT